MNIVLHELHHRNQRVDLRLVQWSDGLQRCYYSFRFPPLGRSPVLCSRALASYRTFLYPLSFICYSFSGRGYITDRPKRSHQLGLQLTPPRTSDAAFEVRGRQRRRRERHLTHLQRTTDRGWTEPPGTPAGNVTQYAALGSLD